MRGILSQHHVPAIYGRAIDATGVMKEGGWAEHSHSSSPHEKHLQLGRQRQFRMSGTVGDHGGGGLDPERDWCL
jgi:hypothetical protein